MIGQRSTVDDVRRFAETINALRSRIATVERAAQVGRMQAGSTAVTFAASTSSSLTITFAAGRFRAAPRLVCQVRSSSASAVGMTFRTTAITATSATVSASLGSSTTGSFDVDWIAVENG